jgi:tetratricopeptide (TPR) repeat protein
MATLETADESWLRRIADFWEAEGQTEMALAAYQRVLARAPDSQRDHMHAAIALIRLGRSGEAGGHLARSGAVALQPRAQKALVAAYLEAGHLTQARGLLESIPPQATNAAWARARLDELTAADG